MKIIQLTDTHLFSDDSLTIFTVKSNAKFKEVLDRVILEDYDADMIFLTGDISQDETSESYEKIARLLSKLNIPIYWIPGNHDDCAQAEMVFHKTKNFNRKAHLSTPHWHFIFLNTKIENRDDGHLSPSELNALRRELAASPTNKRTAVVMHHHPEMVGTPLIDHYILQNRQAFWDIVTGSSVELIICGHVHGNYQFMHNGIMIESSPATCLQWEKGVKELVIDNKIGYKAYQFDHDGYTAAAKVW